MRTLSDEQLTQVQQMTPAEYRESWAWTHLMLRGEPEAKALPVAYLQTTPNQRQPGQPGAASGQGLPRPHCTWLSWKSAGMLRLQFADEKVIHRPAAGSHVWQPDRFCPDRKYAVFSPGHGPFGNLKVCRPPGGPHLSRAHIAKCQVWQPDRFSLPLPVSFWRARANTAHAKTGSDGPVRYCRRFPPSLPCSRAPVL
jgi:hypothetical protein